MSGHGPIKARIGLCDPACRLWAVAGKGVSLDPAQRRGPFAWRAPSGCDHTGQALGHPQPCGPAGLVAGHGLYVP